MDMGYVNEMAFFFRQAAAQSPAPGLFQGLAATTRATLGAVESLRCGKAVTIEKDIRRRRVKEGKLKTLPGLQAD
jgi:hypothetical protein